MVARTLLATATWTDAHAFAHANHIASRSAIS
jgi:hypothetical protein